MIWTDERLAHLHKRYIIDKASATVIAKELGSTRSAVCGKANRLGWLRGQPSKPREAAPYPQRPAKIARRGEKPVKTLVKPLRKASEPVGGVPDGGVPLMALGHRMCRFSVSQATNGDWLFCGRATEEGSSWCPACAVRVFAPSKVRAA